MRSNDTSQPANLFDKAGVYRSRGRAPTVAYHQAVIPASVTASVSSGHSARRVDSPCPSQPYRMSHRNIHQRNPPRMSERREQGVVQSIHIERERAGSRRQHLPRLARSGCCPEIRSAFIEIGLERAHSCIVVDIWEEPAKRPWRRGTRPSRRSCTRPTLSVQVVEGSNRHEGARLSTQIRHRRAHARLSAAGSAYRHFAAHRE